MHLRNAPTGLMKGLGYGRGYEYPHDAPERFVATPNLPEALRGERFYEPTREGAEAEIADRLAGWRARRDPRRPSQRRAPRASRPATPRCALVSSRALKTSTRLRPFCLAR